MQKQIDLEASVNEFVNANLLEIRKNTEIRNKFIELLIEYYILYTSKSTFENYSSELMDTATYCLKYFNSQKGAFTHLFNSEMKKAVKRAKYRESQENKRRGVVLPREAERLVRQMFLYARRMGLNLYERYTQEILSNEFNIPIEIVEQLIYAEYKAKPVRDCMRDDDGEEISIFDLNSSCEKTAEDKMADEAGFTEVVEEIDRVFTTVQNRQKRFLSMLLTVEIIKACDEALDKAKNVLTGKELFSEEVLDYYKKHGKLLTNRKIAEICGISEQSLSRTYKNFKEKLK
jgi:hypothetical protein